jgi:hypothetical protein
MSAEELINVMKIYLGGGATWGMLDKGLLLSLRELSEFEFPFRYAKRRLIGHRERYLSLAQSHLNHMIFRGVQHNPYHFVMPYQPATIVNYSTISPPEFGEESSPVAPTAGHTFALPLRLVSQPSIKTVPETVEQQLHSVDLRLKVREDDIGMRLD